MSSPDPNASPASRSLSQAGAAAHGKPKAGAALAAAAAPESFQAAQVSAVEALNDRFLREVVESWRSCPYARGCRDAGKLWRTVCWADDDAVASEQRILRVMAQLERAAGAAEAGPPEVALLVLPALAHLESPRFDALHVRLRTAHEAAFPQSLFYNVAFHPGYPIDNRTPSTLVRLFRRSPDPTLQFVAKAVLQPLRKTTDEAERVRTASALLAAGADTATLAAALRAPRDVSVAVAEANAQRFERESAAMLAQLEQLLADAAEVRRAREAALVGQGRRGGDLEDGAWWVVQGAAGTAGPAAENAAADSDLSGDGRS